MREVRLEDIVPGRLFLCEMPGLYFSLDEYEKEFADKRVSRIFCLAPLPEIRQKSPLYAAKLEQGEFPFPVEIFPIEDYGVPHDIGELTKIVENMATCLRQGERVVIHCGAGIGRTGTVAICVLQALDLPLIEAATRVHQAGSGPETEDQRALAELFGTFIKDRKGGEL